MYQTVHGSLHLALKIGEGETLLIRGGTSSIGMLAAQVAKLHGLIVLATTRNPKKERKLLENGVTQVLIDDGDLEPQLRRLYSQGVDKLLELVGTTTLRDSLQCVKPGGTVCMTGMLSESWSIPDFSPMEFIPAAVHFTVYDSGQDRSPAHVFQDFIDSVAAGDIHLRIGKVFSLDEIVEAHQLMESNLTTDNPGTGRNVRARID
jgi:NADPH:quinone reductase-like Zn-dependent oxidoreductase